MTDKKFNIGTKTGGVPRDAGNTGRAPGTTGAIAAEALAFAMAIRSAGEAFQELLNSLESLGGVGSGAGAGASAMDHRAEMANAGPADRVRRVVVQAGEGKGKQGTLKAAREERKDSQEVGGNEGWPGLAGGAVSRLQHGFRRLAGGVKRLTGSAGMARTAVVPVTRVLEKPGVPEAMAKTESAVEHGRQRKEKQRRKHFRHHHKDSLRDRAPTEETVAAQPKRHGGHAEVANSADRRARADQRAGAGRGWDRS